MFHGACLKCSLFFDLGYIVKVFSEFKRRLCEWIEGVNGLWVLPLSFVFVSFVEGNYS